MIDPEKTTVILGPPGTGKTTFALGIVDSLLRGDVSPDRIGYFAFTTRAANEAIDRACEKFNLKRKQLPYFRTLHSLAFRQLHLTRRQVVQMKDYIEFGREQCLPITGRFDTDEGAAVGYEMGDRIIFYDNLARVTEEDFDQTLLNYSYPGELISGSMVAAVASDFEEFKRARGLIDYTDMLRRFVLAGIVPKLDYIIVDEGQDLSMLQWHVVAKLSENAQALYVAGDDDQAIYRWAGAAVEYFIHLKGDVKILNQSYRIPRNVQALSNSIIDQVSDRRQKLWHPRDEEGFFEFCHSIEQIDMSQGEWLVLARNNRHLDDISAHLRTQGWYFDSRKQAPIDPKLIEGIYVYEQRRKGEVVDEDKFAPFLQRKFNFQQPWFEAFELSASLSSYIRACLRNQEKLRQPPRIRLRTIHSAKGAEADNVVLLTKLAKRTQEWFKLQPDDEHRVFYVGATRAKERLFIVQEHVSQGAYPIFL